MSLERHQLEAAIAALEAQRTLLGDDVVAAAIKPISARLAQLAISARTIEQQLKQVTVLFLDVVGSTELSSNLEPEDVHAVMDGALARWTRIVEAFGGKTLQYAGDSLLAAFGAREAHEDDPESAVRCGLALLADGRVVSKDVKRHHGIDGFNVRIGIHTGPVLLGGGVDGEGTIRGMAVNIAARMEQSAPAGALRISDETYRQVRGRFDVSEQPAFSIKGVEAPVRTYLVHAVNPETARPQRGIEGVVTRMVGRDPELGRLASAFGSLLTSSSMASLTVVGDAGLGKSRLLREFSDWVQRQPQRCEWFEARASEARRNRPYGLLGDLFRSRFRILESDDEPVVTDKWLQNTVPVLGSQDDAAILGNLLGFGFETHAAVSGIAADPKQIRDRGFHYAAAYFSRVAVAHSEGGRPVLFLLDDLHWADDGSLDFVDYFQSTHTQARALVIGFARPQLYERRPFWGKDHRCHERIDLDPLDVASSHLLADALLNKLFDVPVRLRELIVGRGEGNPFYMEELVRMLIDDGVIVAKGERWEIASDRLVGAKVPGTLTGVLQARLDALSPFEKRALQDASVIGHVFWDEALHALNPQAVQALPGLLERDLVQAHGSASFEGTREFAFKHHLLHQVTYDGILKREKRVLHGKTAQWLVARSDDRALTLLPLVAEHFERAGDGLAAARYWQRAAEDALARDAREAALSFADRAVTLVDESDAERRFALAVVKDRVFTRRFEREARLANLLELERLALLVGNDNMHFDAALCRASYLESGGDFEGALPVARGALQKANGGTPSQRARAFNRIANALIRLGRYAEATEPVCLGLDAAREARNVQTETELLNLNGLLLSELGDVVEARGWYEQALAKQQAVGNPLGVARSVGNLAEIDRMLGCYELAHAGFVEQARVSKLIGDPWLEAMAQLNLSLVVLNQGDAPAAAGHAQHALGAFRKMGERWGEACALVNLGHAELGNGRIDSALESYETAQHRFDQLGIRHLALEAMAGMADTLLAAGNTSGAMDQVEAILGRLAEGVGLDGLDEPLRLRWTCYRVLDAASDARAVGMLAAAHAELMARAEKVSDPHLRDRLLNDIPYHRAIVRAGSRG